METTSICDTKLGGNEKKVENGSNLCEGDHIADAEEEMVTSESKTPLKTPLKEVEVKFIVNDSLNGDAKIDLDNGKSPFAGMAKEELMKYANDPFWVKTRLFLFIIFWIIWIGMFVSAIAIIVTAPRCEPPKPLTWFQKGPLYEIDLKSLENVAVGKSLLQEVKDKLDYLKTLDVKGIILSPIFKTLDEDDDDENVIDYTLVDEKIGSVQDIENLTKEANKRKIHVILSFVPNHSSDKHEWFNKSAAGIAPYKDYYVWAPPASINTKDPPNNWRSKNDESAWKWNEQRQAFYLHQFKINQPDLNFHNPDVIKEFNNTLKYWLKLGVSGFNFDKVQYLLEDKDLSDETIGSEPGSIHTDYKFYNHFKTHNLPGVADILSSWRQIIQNETNSQGVLIITGDVPKRTNESQSNAVDVDVTRTDRLLSNLKEMFSAKELGDNIEKIIKKESWTGVQLGGRGMPRVADRFGEEAVDGLNMIFLLLNATPITYFGEESGLNGSTAFMWGNDTEDSKSIQESHAEIYKTLVRERTSAAVEHGNFTVKVFNDSLVAVIRVKSGSPGILVVYNPTPNNVTEDLNFEKYLPDELEVLAVSLNYGREIVKPKSKLKSKGVLLTPKSALAFQFVPKTE